MTFLHAPPGQPWAPYSGGAHLPGGWTRLGGGVVTPGARGALPLVIELRDRCSPWVSLYAGPTVWGRLLDPAEVVGVVMYGQEGGVWEKCGGQASFDPVFIALNLQCGSEPLISVMMHEVWHQCSHHMRPDILAEIDKELAGAHRWGSKYYDDPDEIRARAFQCWTGGFRNGLPPRPAHGVVDEIFWHVFSGGFANEIKTLEAA